MNEELIALQDKIQTQSVLNQHLINLISNGHFLGKKGLKKLEKKSEGKKKTSLITLDFPIRDE